MTEVHAPPAQPPAPRPGRRLGFVSVFAWGLRWVVRWRKVVAVAAAAIGVGIALGIAVSDARDPAQELARVLDRGLLTFGLPLVALLLVSDGFAFEVAQKTLVHHLVRPVSRTTVFLARFASGWIPAALVSTAFLVAAVASSSAPLPPSIWPSLAATAAMAALALGAVFYVLSALFRHGLVASLIYAFVVEGFVSSVPGSMQRFSVMFQVRSLFHGLAGDAIPRAPDAARGAAVVFGSPERVEDTDPTTALIVLLVTTAVVLAFGAWHVARRDYGLRE